MKRAKTFYDTVFNIEIKVQDFEGTLMGWFPFANEKPGASGSLIQNEAYIPSETHGTLIYFSSDNIQDELNRVKAVGGKIIQQKTQISPEIGYMAVFIDVEGNRIALYSKQ